MTDLAEYVQLWKTHGSATNAGDDRTCNSAMKQLIKMFKEFEQDPDAAADFLGPLLKNEDSWVASGAASHCLALGVHVKDALAVLRRVSKQKNDLSALNAEMLLKQWNEQGFIRVYEGQKAPPPRFGENSASKERATTGRRAKRVLLAILCLILTIGVILPYGKVEFLTATHGNEFATGYLQTGMIDEIEYLKVMAYSPHKAKVYYVAKDKTSGNVIKFTKDEISGWKLAEWETVWSTTGSADGFIWPYYR